MREHVATLCPTCGPDCCPEIYFDSAESPERQVEIKDDFGNNIFMSKDQFSALISMVKEDKIKL
jgi:hypothetical protein